MRLGVGAKEEATTKASCLAGNWCVYVWSVRSWSSGQPPGRPTAIPGYLAPSCNGLSPRAANFQHAGRARSLQCGASYSVAASDEHRWSLHAQDAACCSHWGIDELVTLSGERAHLYDARRVGASLASAHPLAAPIGLSRTRAGFPPFSAALSRVRAGSPLRDPLFLRKRQITRGKGEWKMKSTAAHYKAAVGESVRAIGREPLQDQVPIDSVRDGGAEPPVSRRPQISRAARSSQKFSSWENSPASA